MIRQAISCDICGTDMQQTNHWFVAYDQGAELRVAAWNARTRLRAGAKHLCGQTCLHKLVDVLLARTAPVRAGSQVNATRAAENEGKDAAVRPALPPADPPGAVPRLAPRPVGSDFEPYVDEYESSARLIPAGIMPVPSAAPAVTAARAWRSDAWKREREREQNAARQAGLPRRRSIA